jgi:uncharacterized protein YlzI (FlbEa/FlbD family)
VTKFISVTKIEVKSGGFREVRVLLNPEAIVSIVAGALPSGKDGSFITMLAERSFVVKESVDGILKANPTSFGPFDAYSNE